MGGSRFCGRLGAAMLAALNRPHEFKLHLAGALRNDSGEQSPLASQCELKSLQHN